ncbi:MAG: hypothetical protein WA005_13900 [Candidatus Binataceae bacterium]
MVLLGIGPVAALKAALAALIVAGGLGVYGLVYGETSRGDGALIGALVYLFLPYHFTDLFRRGELSEFAAYSIVPFALWGYRALGRTTKAGRAWIGALTAVAHGAVWFYHPIIALCLTALVAMLLCFQVLGACGRRGTLRYACFGLCVALLGTLLASVYLAPAWFEQSLVRLDKLRLYCQPTTKYLVNWRWLFQFGFFSVGTPSTVGAVVLAAGCALPRIRRNMTGAILWWLPAVLYLPLMVDCRFSVWLWRVVPLGRYILFPWRLMGFVGLFAAIGTGVMWASLTPLEWRKLRWAGAALAGLLIALSSNGYNRAGFVSSLGSARLRPAAIRGGGMITTVAADEFLPRTVAIPPEFPRYSQVLPAPLEVAPAVVHAREVTPLRYAIDAQVSKPTILDLRVFDFPGWRVETLRGPAKAR